MVFFFCLFVCFLRIFSVCIYLRFLFSPNKPRLELASGTLFNVTLYKGNARTFPPSNFSAFTFPSQEEGVNRAVFFNEFLEEFSGATHFKLESI